MILLSQMDSRSARGRNDFRISIDDYDRFISDRLDNPDSETR